MGRPIDADALEMQIDAEQKRLWSNDDKEWERNKPYYKGLALARRLLLDAPTMPDPNWISADKPPEVYRGYYGELIPFLVCGIWTEYPYRAFYDGEHWTSCVKFWMPLPAPPKEE